MRHSPWYTPLPRWIFTAFRDESGQYPLVPASWATVAGGSGAHGTATSSEVTKDPSGTYRASELLVSVRLAPIWDNSINAYGNKPYGGAYPYSAYNDPADPGYPGALAVEYEGLGVEYEPGPAATDPVLLDDTPLLRWAASANSTWLETHPFPEGGENHPQDPILSWTVTQVPDDADFVTVTYPYATLNRWLPYTDLAALDSANRIFRDVPPDITPDLTEITPPIEVSPVDGVMHFLHYPTALEGTTDPTPSFPHADGYTELFGATLQPGVRVQGPRYRYQLPGTDGLRSRQRSNSSGGAPRSRQVMSQAGGLRRGPGAAP